MLNNGLLVDLGVVMSKQKIDTSREVDDYDIYQVHTRVVFIP